MKRSRKREIHSPLFCIFFLLSSCLLFCPLYTTSAQEITGVALAPVNPHFLEYITNVQTRILGKQASDGYSLGLMPSPHDISYLTGKNMVRTQQVLAFPSSYDLRAQGKLTPVKDQGNCGSCWTFGTYGSLESMLMPSEVWDFSENNLKNTHGFDQEPCAGGNAYMSAAYLSRWGGPVHEQDDPYNPLSGVSPIGSIEKNHLQEALIIPDRAGPLDNDKIKQALLTYGGLYTTMYWNSSFYYSLQDSYYYNGTNNSNHAVVIVGWNDGYPASYFPTVPPGNGAFIVKNSWGKGFGDYGYFYISYYDSNIGTGNFVFNTAEAVTNYSHIYQYDPLGWVSSLGYGTTSAWFANIFHAYTDEKLLAVSFYTASFDSPYEMYIYKEGTSSPVSGTLAYSQAGTIAGPGYHTTALNSPVFLSAGQRFSIVMQLTTPGYNYPIPIENKVANYSSLASAYAGESYISYDGTSWSDITSYYPNTNVCIKAFTLDYPLFADVPISHSLYHYIEELYRQGITSGCSESPLNYCPQSPVTRGQMAAFIVRAEFGENFAYNPSPYFTDIPDTHWAFKYIQKMYDEGITTGYSDGTYRPSENVTRAQMATFINKALFGDSFSYTSDEYFSDIPDTHWAFKYIQKMYDEGITTGYSDGTYRPAQYVSRAQMATFIGRAFLGMP